MLLRAVLVPRVTAARKAKEFDIGASIVVRDLGPYLSVARSAAVAGALLQLGWSVRQGRWKRARS